MEPPPAAATDGDLERALHNLSLGHLLPKFHAPLGVRRLTEVVELEVEDLEEIGLTRLQIRRLLRAAGASQAVKSQEARPKRVPSPPPPPNSRTMGPELPNARSLNQSPLSRSRRESPEASRRRSSSPCVERRWSASRATSKVSFRSVSSCAGLDFEQRCRSAILLWLKGYGEEVCPKAFGIQHDCDLLVKLSSSLELAKILPKSFRLLQPNPTHCDEGSLLFFEMKSRAHRVDHAICQLRKRQELLQLRSAATRQVHLFAILAVMPSDRQAFQLLQDASWKHADIKIAAVDPQCLAAAESDVISVQEETQLVAWRQSKGDSEDALKQDVCKALAVGPVQLVVLASSLGFAKRYNKLFHEGRRVNDGSWTKFLLSIPGIQVEVNDKGCYMPHSKVVLTKYATAPLKEAGPSWQKDDWNCQNWQPVVQARQSWRRPWAPTSTDRAQGA